MTFWSDHWFKRRLAPQITLIAGTLTALLSTIILIRIYIKGTDLPRYINHRQLILKCLHPGDRILAEMKNNPGPIEDSSFYGITIIWNDFQYDKICDLAQSSVIKRRLPICDHLTELNRQEPALIDLSIFGYAKRHMSIDDFTRLEMNYIPILDNYRIRRDRSACLQNWDQIR